MTSIISNLTVNIIQSIIFGVTHYSYFSSFGIFGIIGTANHMMIGFILGQLYIYSGSLMPGILVHALIDL